MPTYALSIVSVSTLIASDDVVNSFLVALSDLGDVRNGHFPDTLEAFDDAGIALPKGFTSQVPPLPSRFRHGDQNVK